MLAPAARSTSHNGPREAIEYWSRLGVAVLPGPRGEKGPWPHGWPSLPAREAWELASAAAWRPINLAVRLGATDDGTRVLAHLDLDGKCPCGSDLADHESAEGGLGRCRSAKCQERGCGCERYEGVPPDDGLARLLGRLPEQPLIIRTGRGHRLLFWSAREYRAGTLPEFRGRGGPCRRALGDPAEHAPFWRELRVRVSARGRPAALRPRGAEAATDSEEEAESGLRVSSQCSGIS